MDTQFAKRVSAAAGAAWWTVLIVMVWMTLTWVAFAMWMMPCKPGWILELWGGGDLTWAQVHTIVLYFFGVMKLMMFVLISAALFLTIWGRKLLKVG